MFSVLFLFDGHSLAQAGSGCQSNPEPVLEGVLQGASNGAA